MCFRENAHVKTFTTNFPINFSLKLKIQQNSCSCTTGDMASKVLDRCKAPHNMGLWPARLLVVLSFYLAIWTVFDLEWEEHISIKRGSLLFFCGLIFFSALYQTLNGLFFHTKTGRRIIKQFNLSQSDVFDISNKNVSAVQALFCCVTGLTSTLYSCPRNMLKTSHYISEAYGWYGAAYFLYDIWSMYKVYSAKTCESQTQDVTKSHNLQNQIFNYSKNNAVIIGHHIFIGGFGFLVITHLRGGLGDCFFGFVYLMEASTPFVSLRGILSKIGMKSSRLYVINGLVMLGMFFVCRVLMFPFVLKMYAYSINMDFIPAVLTLPRGCLISISILVLPQVYWFFLMAKGAFKVLTQKKPSLKTNGLSSKTD